VRDGVLRVPQLAAAYREFAAAILGRPRSALLDQAEASPQGTCGTSWFKALPFGVARIGLEAGLLSQWLDAGLKAAGFAVELLETRHVRDAFKAMPVKTDRNDARGIAQLMRLGWFRPVHCKSAPAQETRALLTARKLVQGKLHI
jgi:transposase